MTAPRSGKRLTVLAVVLATLASAVALVHGSPAGAYPGAPWFEPGKPYSQNFPDPSIVVGDGIYYAYGAPTGGAYLPVMTSTDLVTWTARPAYDPGAPLNEDPYFNDALPHPARWGADRPVGGRMTKELWAPGAAKIGSRWVVYYAVRTRLDRDRFCISVATSSNPLGPFTDNTSGPLVCDADPNGSIDPQPFVDTDGTPYLLWKSEGVPGSQPTRIWVRQLDRSGTAFAPGSSPRILLSTSQAWEGSVIENPSMVRYQGQLFLLYSGNEHLSSRYAIGYAACDSVLGPCHKSPANPLLRSAGNRLGPGGPAAFVDLHGRLQMAYHWWNAPYTSYPNDPGCDGIDPKTGGPYCVSQGQRRMSVATLSVAGHRLTVLGDARLPPPDPRNIDDACPPGQVPSAGFTDVATSSVHADAVDCVVWWGVAQGRGAGRYGPKGIVTRGQMASFIARLLEEAGVELDDDPPNAFPDDDASVHALNIDRLAQREVVGGLADGTYGPNRPVDRAQMATFLVRAAAETGVVLTARRDVFPDDEGFVHEANIDAAAASGLTGGRADGSYGPRLAVRRGQMASFLARLLDLLVDDGVTTAP